MRADLGARLPGFESQFCHVTAADVCRCFGAFFALVSSFVKGGYNSNFLDVVIIYNIRMMFSSANK